MAVLTLPREGHPNLQSAICNLQFAIFNFQFAILNSAPSPFERGFAVALAHASGYYVRTRSPSLTSARDVEPRDCKLKIEDCKLQIGRPDGRAHPPKGRPPQSAICNLQFAIFNFQFAILNSAPSPFERGFAVALAHASGYYVRTRSPSLTSARDVEPRDCKLKIEDCKLQIGRPDGRAHPPKGRPPQSAICNLQFAIFNFQFAILNSAPSPFERGFAVALAHASGYYVRTRSPSLTSARDVEPRDCKLKIEDCKLEGQMAVLTLPREGHPNLQSAICNFQFAILNSAPSPFERGFAVALAHASGYYVRTRSPSLTSARDVEPRDCKLKIEDCKLQIGRPDGRAHPPKGR